MPPFGNNDRRGDPMQYGPLRERSASKLDRTSQPVSRPHSASLLPRLHALPFLLRVVARQSGHWPREIVVNKTGRVAVITLQTAAHVTDPGHVHLRREDREVPTLPSHERRPIGGGPQDPGACLRSNAGPVLDR